MSRKTVLKSPADGLIQLAILNVYMRRINYYSATVDISVLIGQINIAFRNISLQTMRLGGLDQLGSRRAMQLLIFLSCLSPGRVKKLQKFINSCLKVGHSANLKHSKSTYNWRELIVQWNVENHNIKSCGHNARSALLDRGTGAIHDSCRFDIGRFRAEPTNYKFVYTRVTHLHIAVPTMTCTLRYT